MFIVCALGHTFSHENPLQLFGFSLLYIAIILHQMQTSCPHNQKNKHFPLNLTGWCTTDNTDRASPVAPDAGLVLPNDRGTKQISDLPVE